MFVQVFAHVTCEGRVIGLKVTEVAHDFQIGVKKYVTEELGLVNSYDTWHCNIVFIRLEFSGCEMNRDKEHGQSSQESGSRCSQG